MSVEGHVPGLDRDPPATGHRVPGIDDEVEHRRLELRWIDLRRGEDRAQRRDHLDLLADNPMHQVFDINDQLVQIDGVGTGDLPSRIGQELPDEVLSSLRRSHGALRQAFDFLGVAPRPQDQIEIAEDDGQEIVEIVRDPSGQLTDSLEALGLSERFARAGELCVAFARDGEGLIKAAGKAARLDQHNGQPDARSKQTEKTAGIKTDVEAPRVDNRAECHIEHPSAEDDHQPQIEN